MSETKPTPPPTPGFRKWHRIAMAVLCYAALLSLGYWVSDWLVDTLGLEPREGALIVSSGKVWLGVAAYSLLLALPFVPGVEISLALLAAFGSAIAIQLYVATLAAFIMPYAAGRLFSTTLLSAFFRAVGLTSAEALVQRLRPLSPKERVALLVEQAPRRFIPTLLRYRYVALVLAFNLPGNAVLGGGGGIALLAGVSGVYSFPLYLVSAAIAALPLPMAALLLGAMS